MKTYLELEMDQLIMRGYEDTQQLDRCVVFFHGFTGNKTETNRMFVHITEEFKKIKMSSIRLDWFGHGESEHLQQRHKRVNNVHGSLLVMRLG